MKIPVEVPDIFQVRFEEEYPCKLPYCSYCRMFAEHLHIKLDWNGIC